MTTGRQTAITLGVTNMSTETKPYTIDELVTAIYEDNYSHFEFMENMNGGDCDCHLHQVMTTIVKYWGE